MSSAYRLFMCSIEGHWYVCSNCLAEVPKDATQCDNCGATLTDKEVDPQLNTRITPNMKEYFVHKED